jgi:hypothetical protein
LLGAVNVCPWFDVVMSWPLVDCKSTIAFKNTMSTVPSTFSGRRVWGRFENSKAIPNVIPTWMSTLGICITLVGCCAGNFYFTNLGPRIQTVTGLYPFVYEIGVALACAGSLATLIFGGGRFNSTAHYRILAVLAFYIPIFTNAVLDPTIRGQFGRNPLRLQVEAMLFGVSLLLVPPSLKVLRWALGVLVLGAMVNAFANVLYVTGTVIPLWPPIMRETTTTVTVRYSGLFPLPTQVGLISAIGAVAVCSLTKRVLWRTLAIVLCVVSTYLADSRTGLIALAFGLTVMWLYSGRSVGVRVAAIGALLFAAVTMGTVLLLGDPAILGTIVKTEGARVFGILTVIQNFSRHPMGIGWGQFDDLQSQSIYSGGASPHNWPMIALLYGGIISFTLVMGFHMSLIRSWLRGVGRPDFKERFTVPLALLITCVACSWFEQAFQIPITLFTFFLALAALSAPVPEQATRPLVRLPLFGRVVAGTNRRKLLNHFEDDRVSVTTRLKGGMGNQMFQYAAGLALARRLGADLSLDVTWYDRPGESRLYSLGLWKGVVEPRVRGLSGRIIRERGLPYNPELFARATGECSIDGYWQTEWYFSELRDELVARFTPAQTLPPSSLEMLRRIEAEGRRSVFLTVRRTDYVGNGLHGVLPQEYYQQAMRIIASKIDDPCFFVFSDEPQWCEQYFRLEYRSVIAGNWDRTVPGHLGREDAELWLMTRCSHAIMANSSYSWWGAWLNPRQDGIVIGPKNWFGPKSKEDPKHIMPDRWVKI